MADAITDAMIEAGVKALRERVTLRFPHMDAPTVEEIYLAMEAARQPQLPSDDGLIKALEAIAAVVEDYERDGYSDRYNDDEAILGRVQWKSADYPDLPPRVTWGQLKAIREAVSRHKAPLSVAGDDGERVPPIDRQPYCTPHEWLLLSSYCGDDNDDCTEQRPCADCLAMCNVFDERGKFLRELGALTALQVTEGDKLLNWLGENVGMELSWGEIDGDLSECAWQVHRRQGGTNDREWNLIATGETPLAALQSARSQSNKVSKPL